MSIVLKENEWAKKMIDSNSLGKKPSETLKRVARYYIDNGYNTKETRKLLDTFLLKCDPSASLPKWSDSLDYAVNRASKYSAVDIDSISISKSEMDKIDSVKGRQAKRLAFTLLCLAKYWKCIRPESDYWVNNKDTEIMSMANINTSLKRQAQMYSSLKDIGLIQFSRKVDNTNVKVCFVDNSDSVLEITDFRNLGYQYLMYHGEPFFECESCGLVVKMNDPDNKRRQKYCPECSVKIKTKQKVNAVMRHRQTKK